MSLPTQECRGIHGKVRVVQGDELDELAQEPAGLLGPKSFPTHRSHSRGPPSAAAMLIPGERGGDGVAPQLSAPLPWRHLRSPRSASPFPPPSVSPAGLLSQRRSLQTEEEAGLP